MKAAWSARASDAAFAAAACVVLAWYNNVAARQPWHRRWYPAVNACAAGAALAAAAASGLTADDMGLRPDRLRTGLTIGAAAAAPVAAAFGAAALTPATRPLLLDERVTGLTARELGYHVLLRIPVGTVLWEEVAFRGVLHAALSRVLGKPAATVTGSAVFGIWHIRPTAEALGVNQVAAEPAARIGALTAVTAGTAAAGALLSVLRGRSGSLAAPVLVHLTANCTGALASAVASRLIREDSCRAGGTPTRDVVHPNHAVRLDEEDPKATLCRRYSETLPRLGESAVRDARCSIPEG